MDAHTPIRSLAWRSAPGRQHCSGVLPHTLRHMVCALGTPSRIGVLGVCVTGFTDAGLVVFRVGTALVLLECPLAPAGLLVFVPRCQQNC
jgi:hypothetical protein